MSKRKGFTLIELLVVISIIALLMAILMPVLGRARKQAWQAVCRSNLRQIGIDAAFYADDNDQSIPRGAPFASGGRRAPGIWFELFMPYLSISGEKDDYRNVKIYHCPAYPNKQQTVCYVINAWGFKDKLDTVGYEVIWPKTKKRFVFFNQQFCSAGFDNCSALQVPMADRNLFQMDQAIHANQNIFWHYQERGENSNLDRHQRLHSGIDCQEGTANRVEFGQNPANSQHCPFRESSY